ncbi:type 2 periplasmic-binding domain-containing protein [Algoriphagus mannitolivorans]|uniref:hypothetical protein n=1 Tax=Algoriphagus mannitolivorans TaxID=226504 RepID=UPI000409C43A|nr:hypothetical protein [Algoriphagus mannitolivorans]
MKTFRIVGVPEHFNFPFRILKEKQPFKEEGLLIEWREESRGSGQMALDLKNGDADMAIMLTESFLKEFESNSDVKMAGFHVNTPLTWGVHVSPTHQAKSAEQIQSRHFLVSRMGSGSHLMAMVLADAKGWKKNSLTFELVGNLDGAKEAFDSGSPGMFLWEKYTTTPEVKAGSMKRIGEIPSPWPCFVFVVNERSIQEFSPWINRIRNQVYAISKSLSIDAELPIRLSESYHLNLEDVKAWIKQTKWTTEGGVSKKALKDILDQTIKFEIIKNKINPEDFLFIPREEILD